MQAECLIPPFGMNGCDFQYILLNGLVILDFGFRTYQVITTPEDFVTVSEAIEAAGIPVEASEVEMIPNTTVALQGDQAKTMKHLIEELEGMDDVQEVHHNAELPEENEE